MSVRSFVDTNVIVCLFDARRDALVVETASEAGCAVVSSEDLQHGRDVEGVRIENPFA